MVKRLGERDLRTRYGTFREVLYYDGQRESIALVMGDVSGVDVLCRIHSACVGGHVLIALNANVLPRWLRHKPRSSRQAAA